MSTNLVEERTVNLEAVTSIAPQSTSETIGPTPVPHFFTIPNEEVSNVKDFVMFGFHAREYLGVEASGSSRPPMM